LRFDEDDSGQINIMELGEMLRHMGYCEDQDEMHGLVLQVDENRNGQLDFREVLRLMRLFRERECAKLRSVFVEAKGDAGKTLSRRRSRSGNVVPCRDGTLTVSQREEALETSGLEVSSEVIDACSSKDLDLDTFVGICDSCRAEYVRKPRRQAGFSDNEITDLRMIF